MSHGLLEGTTLWTMYIQTLHTTWVSLIISLCSHDNQLHTTIKMCETVRDIEGIAT